MRVPARRGFLSGVGRFNLTQAYNSIEGDPRELHENFQPCILRSRANALAVENALARSRAESVAMVLELHQTTQTRTWVLHDHAPRGYSSQRAQTYERRRRAGRGRRVLRGRLNRVERRHPSHKLLWAL